MKITKLISIITALVAGTIVLSIFLGGSTGAEDESLWRRSDIRITETNVQPRPKKFLGKYIENVAIVNTDYPNGTVADGVIYRGESLAWLKIGPDNYIKYGDDVYFREVVTAGDGELTLVDGTNTLLIERPFEWTDIATGPTYFRTINLQESDFEATAWSADGAVTRYSLRYDEEKQLLPATNMLGDDHVFGRYVLSDNGRYMLVLADNQALVLVDLKTTEARVIAERINRRIPTPGVVSNDGRYVVNADSATLIDTYGCGDMFDASKLGGVSGVGIEHACKSYSFRSLVDDSLGVYDGGFGFVLKDNNILEYSVQEDADSPVRFVKIEGIQNALARKLTYLALGDSYSSGEGDIERQGSGLSYYIPPTGVQGGCHVSERSYPFRLRNLWGVGKYDMNSIACSGALLREDYSSSAASYPGQHSELNGLNSNERNSKIKTALNRFYPGIVPQLEFIKEYQPSVITITGGGNDVGFASIIEYCAQDVLQSVSWWYDCEYVEGGVLHDILTNAIDSQYTAITRLIKDIKQASPATRIYYVGYPSFIGDSSAQCALNSGALSGNEQTMINRAVSRLNFVIRQASTAAGAQYVDIESSLVGGRLCEGSEYVTGVWDVKFVEDLYDQTFHPNSRGHEKIAERIYRQIHDPITDYAPEYGDFVEVAPGKYTVREDITGQDEYYEEDLMDVSLVPTTMVASGEVMISVFSSPTKLGTFQAGTDGSLRARVKLPKSLGSGHHLLLVEGIGPDGKPIRLYQYITIKKKDTSTGNVFEKASSNKDATGVLHLSQNTELVANLDRSTTKTTNLPKPGHTTSEGKGTDLIPIFLAAAIIITIATLGSYIYGKRPH